MQKLDDKLKETDLKSESLQTEIDELKKKADTYTKNKASFANEISCLQEEHRQKNNDLKRKQKESETNLRLTESELDKRAELKILCQNEGKQLKQQIGKTCRQ